MLYLPCYTSHGHEREGDRGIEEEEAAMRGREVPPSSLLRQRKEDRQGARMVNWQYKKCIGQTRDTKVHSVPLGLLK